MPGIGNWVAVWSSAENLVSVSTNNGLSWTPPAVLNTDRGSLQVTTDGAGNWVVVWNSNDDLGGTIGTDLDVLISQFALPEPDNNGIGNPPIAPAACGACGTGASVAMLFSLFTLTAVTRIRKKT